MVYRYNWLPTACCNFSKGTRGKRDLAVIVTLMEVYVMTSFFSRAAIRLATSLFLLLAFTLPGQAQGTVSWLEDYKEAVEQSKRTGKPILALFTGSDWCGWCKKLEEEVFYSDDFDRTAGNAFVFLKVDFPMYTRLPTDQKEQNEELKKQHGVRGFPTVILLDEKQQKITSTGYQSGGGRKYGEYLLKVLADYDTYQKNHHRAAANQMTPQELEELYHQAKELGQLGDLNQIIALGLESTEPSFFLLEHYLNLVEEGKAEEKETVALRTRLLSLDPDNKRNTHRRIAVIDFQRLAEDLEVDESADAWKACKPLLAYIDRWGSQDKDHLWRLQMTVAQTLLNRDHVNDALTYAKNSYDAAPVPMKETIQEAIAEMEQIQQTATHTSVQ
jgi:protein disulfide-isomerase